MSENAFEARLATPLLVRVYAQVDAILRGAHSGWDQALASLRDEIRNELAKSVPDAPPAQTDEEIIQLRMLLRARDRLISEGKTSDEATKLAWEALSAPSSVQLPTIDELEPSSGDAPPRADEPSEGETE